VLVKTLISTLFMIFLTGAVFALNQGPVIGWGSNVGTGDPLPIYNQAIPPEGNSFAVIDAGLYHSIALNIDRTIAAWGANTYGQSNLPSGNDFIMIACGDYHNVAIHGDGSLTSWGYNFSGQVSKTPPGVDFSMIDAGLYHSIALKSDGSLAAWGVDSGLISDSDYGQVTDAPADSNFIAIASGTYHGLAIAAGPGANAGSVKAWGRDADGQATPPAGDDFVAVAAGAKHSLALRSDGTLSAWGIEYDSPYRAIREFYADFGQVTNTPSDNGYIAIAAGDFHNVAMKTDGSIITWGNDRKGQVSDVPTETNLIAVAAGGYHSLAVELDCSYQLQGDLNDDCRVSLSDFHILASAWLSEYTVSHLQFMTDHWLTDCRITPFDPACVPELDCPHQLQGDLNDDCRVSLSDFHILASAWLSGYTVSDLQSMTDHWLTDCRLNPFDTACVPK
jgi:alpha-tubulin suppressor-like RCC1 family protein